MNRTANQEGNKKMAKPNYQFEKRRREMEKKAKKEERRLQKLAAARSPAAADTAAFEFHPRTADFAVLRLLGDPATKYLPDGSLVHR